MPGSTSQTWRTRCLWFNDAPNGALSKDRKLTPYLTPHPADADIQFAGKPVLPNWSHACIGPDLSPYRGWITLTVSSTVKKH